MVILVAEGELQRRVGANLRRLRVEPRVLPGGVRRSPRLPPHVHRRRERGERNLTLRTIERLADAVGGRPARPLRRHTPVVALGPASPARRCGRWHARGPRRPHRGTAGEVRPSARPCRPRCAPGTWSWWTPSAAPASCSPRNRATARSGSTSRAGIRASSSTPWTPSTRTDRRSASPWWSPATWSGRFRRLVDR